ncbi:DUF4342 domain-containing protein [Desulfosporosinus sp. OT]|uniref:DUF4342 domain-containing protein n=1 Tax=Desulfosporosinus sp. OT TaxID=913865 RepID=UPI0002239D09|nr:DUF4342 domain-containing protein [Desulfosporosinus sp. OT]EGW38697.1 hypothetical protein DOT_3370 [Desulfosporosinus sp. OT]
MSEALWTELEKLDVLRERMGIGYEEARVALSMAQGDVVKALDNFEKGRGKGKPGWDFVDRGQGIWSCVKDKLGSFNNTTVSLKKHNDTIVSLSAPVGLALVYTIWRRPGLRMLALAGAVGAAINHYELEVASGDKSSYDDDAFNFSSDRADAGL